MSETLSSEVRVYRCDGWVWEHRWVDDYYGTKCADCGLFYAYGCEPWAPDPEDHDDHFEDDDYEPDEFEEAMYDCHGHFDQQGAGGIFMCGAVGSEDCDECPMHSWLGLTNRQIDRLEGID